MCYAVQSGDVEKKRNVSGWGPCAQNWAGFLNKEGFSFFYYTCFGPTRTGIGGGGLGQGGGNRFNAKKNCGVIGKLIGVWRKGGFKLNGKMGGGISY